VVASDNESLEFLQHDFRRWVQGQPPCDLNLSGLKTRLFDLTQRQRPPRQRLVLTGNPEVMPPASGSDSVPRKLRYGLALTAFAAARMTLITKSGWESMGTVATGDLRRIGAHALRHEALQLRLHGAAFVATI